MMSDFELYRQLLGVVVVFAGLGVLLYFLARRNGTRPWFPQLRNTRGEKHIQLVDRLYLSPQHSLCLVRLGSQVLLVSVHAGGCTLLHSLPADTVSQAC